MLKWKFNCSFLGERSRQHELQQKEVKEEESVEEGEEHNGIKDEESEGVGESPQPPSRK